MGPSLVTMLAEESKALKARIAALETQIDDLNRKLSNVERDNAHLRRDRDHWYEVIQLQRAAQNPDMRALQIYQETRAAADLQRIQAQSQSYQQLANRLEAQNQFALWHDCTCVPGRSAAFGVLGGQIDG